MAGERLYTHCSAAEKLQQHLWGDMWMLSRSFWNDIQFKNEEKDYTLRTGIFDAFAPAHGISF